MREREKVKLRGRTAQEQSAANCSEIADMLSRGHGWCLK